MGLFRGLVCLSGIVLVLTQTVTRPPKIYVEPFAKGIITFFIYREWLLELKCIANGSPTPSYKWQKNGFDWNPSGTVDGRVVQLQNQGTIVFNLTTDRTEGIYQCFAYNDYGVSLSKKINLIEFRLDNFTSTETKTQYAEAGSDLTLPCTPPISYPSADVYSLADVHWSVMDTNGSLAPITLNDRVTKDLEGNLRFTNVQKTDEQGGKAYVCVAVNQLIPKNVTGPQYKVTILGTIERQSPPYELWTSPSDQFFIKGGTLHLKCIFAGNPTPTVHWKKQGDASFHKSGQNMFITYIQYSDAGQYECVGTQNTTNSQAARKSISVRIESIPYWIKAPKVVEAYSGENATFTCQAGGVPAPQYLWYINGVAWESITGTQASVLQRLEVNNDTLRIVNLHPTDQMNIQCNATNTHGYVFADVYLNVLSNTSPIG